MKIKTEKIHHQIYHEKSNNTGRVNKGFIIFYKIFRIWLGRAFIPKIQKVIVFCLFYSLFHLFQHNNEPCWFKFGAVGLERIRGFAFENYTINRGEW